MWGLIHAMLYIPLFLRGKNRQYTTTIVAERRWFPSLKELFQMGITYFSTMIAWVFFRSETISSGIEYIIIIFNNFALPSSYRFFSLHVLVILFFDWIVKESERDIIFSRNKILRFTLYMIILFFYVINLFNDVKEDFIYFQF